jgi:hypothetical protein
MAFSADPTWRQGFAPRLATWPARDRAPSLDGGDVLPDVLPVLGLLERTLLPGSRCYVALTSVSAYGAVREATRSRGPAIVAVFSAAPRPGEAPALSATGVFASASALRHVRGRWRTELRALGRARRQEVLRVTPFCLARVESAPAREEPVETLDALASAVRGAVLRRRDRVCSVVREHLRGAAPCELPGLVMPLLEDVPWTEWQQVLETDSVAECLGFVLGHLHTPSDARRG